MDLLTDFGAASGLRINSTKTVILALHPEGRTQSFPLPDPLAYLPPAAHCRYLGIQASTTVRPATTVAHTWTRAVEQLEVRFRIAELKALTSDQRATIAGPVVLPKLLHIARHACPRPKWIRLLQRPIANFVWHGQFMMDKLHRPGFVNKDIMCLEKKAGGLAMTDLKAELLAFAASEVTRLALTAYADMRVVGDILYAHCTGKDVTELYITPGYRVDGIAGATYPALLWAAGQLMIRVAGLEPLPDPRWNSYRTCTPHSTRFFRRVPRIGWRGSFWWISPSFEGILTDFTE
ncbi:Secreted peptide [Phytophthora megakarya]|uniref:Secreted peptide n=1 Tax=Phytophthora megakarya TaxID=4795 RepID=A0A225UD79_9STRA|nr:Secreted peptide [Phytophthora megakarya]